MVSIAQVELGKDGGSLEKFECRGDEGKAIPVLDSDVVETTVIDAGSEGLVFLLHKEKNQPQQGRKKD